MHQDNHLHIEKSPRNQAPLQFVTGLLCVCLSCTSAFAQNCPPNIDFETGDFANWTCYIGNTTVNNGQNNINLTPSGPMPGRHTMYGPDSRLVDEYGGFPVKCPNGSGYSIKLGNNTGGGEAEGIAYEFTIPAGQDEYSLIYHYAVVFEDPHHEIFQQPRMQVEVMNVTDGTIIDCSSFSFVPYGSILPGFFESSVTGEDGTPVWCKDWSAVSINLDGLAGKTIRLFFKTGDCTFRRHFGYAYIDVNSECSSEFVGAAYCQDDTAVTVTAPYGYQSYRWFNSNFTQTLGSQQSIRFSPPPQAGTTIAVEVIPYDGYGCTDTLYARLLDTLTLTAFAGPDQLYCGENGVQLGVNPRPGLVYSWSPSAGLNNSSISNPFASPSSTTAYCLTVRNNGGGCLSTDSVLVTSSSVNNSIELLGKATYCLGNGDSSILRVNQADQLQWFKDGIPIAGAKETIYRAEQSGSYHAELHSPEGCIVNTRKQPILIDVPKPGITYPIEYAVIDLPHQLRARDFGSTVLWSPGTYLDRTDVLHPVFRSGEDQQYTIRIETLTGCITVDTLLVMAAPKADIFVPTAFTPNNDGRNDLLYPVLMGMKELRYFRVFNRWGQLLYETRKTHSGWNGLVSGKLQPTGVVVWVAEGVGSDNRVYTRTGTTVLMR